MRQADTSKAPNAHIGTMILGRFQIYHGRLQNLLNRRKTRNQDRADQSSSEEWLGSKRTGKHTSFSLWPELHESKGRRKPQRPSHLLKLPFEIREEIFRLVIGMKLLHLVDMANRVGYIQCTAEHNEEGGYWSQKTCNRHCASPLWRLVSYRSTPTFHNSSGFPALLLTCQQNYSQGVGILYSSNIFEAEYPETVVSLATCIRPSLLSSIRFLQISGRARVIKENIGIDRSWEEMWEVICHQMTSLRSLQVKLSIQLQSNFFLHHGWVKYCYKSNVMLREWLKMPVQNLRGMKHCKLVIGAPFMFVIDDPTNVESLDEPKNIKNDHLISFQDKFEMLLCSSAPKGTPEMFPELFNRVDPDMMEQSV